jgi:hypothetical protein
VQTWVEVTPNGHIPKEVQLFMFIGRHLTLQRLGGSANMTIIDDRLEEWCEENCPRQNLAGMVIKMARARCI